MVYRNLCVLVIYKKKALALDSPKGSVFLYVQQTPVSGIIQGSTFPGAQWHMPLDFAVGP